MEEETAMFKKILVPLDGSALSEQPLPLVKELLQGDAEAVTLLTVCEPPPGPGPPGVPL